MDGLGRAIGSPGTWRNYHSNETVLVNPLTLADFGTIENHLLALRQHPLEIVAAEVEKFPDDAHKKYLIDRAKADLRKKKFVVSIGELMVWMESIDGTVFTAWLSLRRNYPRFDSLPAVADWLGTNPGVLASFRRVRDLISGLDVSSLFDWPDSKNSDSDDSAKSAGPLPWRSIVNSLVIEVGMSLESVRQLTPYVAKVIFAEKDVLKGKRKIPGHQARQLGKMTFG